MNAEQHPRSWNPAALAEAFVPLALLTGCTILRERWNLFDLVLLVAGAVAVLGPARLRSWLPSLALALSAFEYSLHPITQSPRTSLVLLACGLGAGAFLLSRAPRLRVAAVALCSLCLLSLAWLGLETWWPARLSTGLHGARPVDGSPVDRLHTRERELGHHLSPGFRGRFIHPEHRRHTVSINEQGFRGEGWPDPARDLDVRLLVLGDSMIFGPGLADDQTLPAVLQRLVSEQRPELEVRVANLGVAGYGWRQEEILLRRWIEDLRPTHVLLCFYDGNDLEDSYTQFRRGHKRGLHQRSLPSDGLRLDLPDLVLYGDPARRPSLWSRTYWQRSSPVYRWFEFRWSRWLPAGPPAPVYNQGLLRAMRRDPDPVLVDQLALTLEALDDVRASCERARAELAVLRIPSKLQTEPHALHELLLDLGQQPDGFDRSLPGRAVLEACGERGVPALDLLPELEVARGSNPRYFREGHANPEGIRVMTELVWQRLLQGEL